jgi:hypothetical protein
MEMEDEVCETPIADPSLYNEEWRVPYPAEHGHALSVPDHCKTLFKVLEGSCLFDEEDECYVFPTGKAFLICSNWADLTRRYFGEDRAVVMGYSHENNSGSAISAQYEGHDFAIVDNRYIVDGWLTGVNLEAEGRQTPGVYDLNDPVDAGENARLYGDKRAWEFSASCYEHTGHSPF